MHKILDANAILRYLLNDDEESALTAKSQVEQGAATIPEVLCECVYVLQGPLYGFERSEIRDALLLLLDDVGIEHEAAMRHALELYSNSSLDFVDCILVGRSQAEGNDIFTFDKKFGKRLEQGF